MIFRFSLAGVLPLLLWHLMVPTAHSLSTPSRIPQRKLSAKPLVDCAMGFACATVMLTGPFPANAAASAQVIQIEADIPALILVAKDNADVLKRLAQQSASAVSIRTGPINWLEFARDAAAGDVFVELNGNPIDISLLSDKGIVDAQVSTSVGDLSVSVASKYLPKLPLFSKRVVDISDSANSGPTTESAALAVDPQAEEEPSASWIQITPELAGGAALGLGVAYGASYAYYIKSGQDEERAAQEKRATLAAAAAAKKKAPPPRPPKTEPVASPVEQPTLSPTVEASSTALSTADTTDPDRSSTPESIAPSPTPNASSSPALTASAAQKRSWKFWGKKE
jgi:ATP synthase E chain